jgi:hypothetical protein
MLHSCSGDFHSLLPVVFKHFSVFFFDVAGIDSLCCKCTFLMLQQNVRGR